MQNIAATPLAALVLAALTTLTAHAERVEVTLEGRADPLVTHVYNFIGTESPGGPPIYWAETGQRYPAQLDGFTQDGRVKLHFGFDAASTLIDKGELTDSLGQVRVQDPVDRILSANGGFWAGAFQIFLPPGQTRDYMYVSFDLAFKPDTLRWNGGLPPSADDHLNALAHLEGGKAHVDLSSRCALGSLGSPNEEMLCSDLSVTLERVTFATAGRSVTVAVPEPSLPALMLVGLASVGLARWRQRGLQRPAG